MTKKQKIVSILSTLTIGAVGGHHLDDIIEKYNLEMGRYPMQLEYKIINNCLSISQTPMAYKVYNKKTEVCICALESAELEYDYENFMLDEDKFLNIFELEAKECLAMRN
ncbi:MAG: hypothetical protein H8E76_02440 [Helicobacteraceae bacterium]|nr:hypothetical protein [Candidatus Sulfurimonas ponti]MBL6973852.1 hypothetical protein [Sulfurimonas sp.]